MKPTLFQRIDRSIPPMIPLLRKSLMVVLIPIVLTLDGVPQSTTPFSGHLDDVAIDTIPHSHLSSTVTQTCPFATDYRAQPEQNLACDRVDAITGSYIPIHPSTPSIGSINGMR